jgi:hypothetical protein
MKTKLTLAGLPISLATSEVASERMEEVSTPSRLTFVEMIKAGIFDLCQKITRLSLSGANSLFASMKYPSFIKGIRIVSYQIALRFVASYQLGW